MTMVRVKVSGYITVPSYEADDILAQEDAANQVESMLEDLELQSAEVEDTEIIGSDATSLSDEDALYEERRDMSWGDAA